MNRQNQPEEWIRDRGATAGWQEWMRATALELFPYLRTVRETITAVVSCVFYFAIFVAAVLTICLVSKQLGWWPQASDAVNATAAAGAGLPGGTPAAVSAACPPVFVECPQCPVCPACICPTVYCGH